MPNSVNASNMPGNSVTTSKRFIARAPLVIEFPLDQELSRVKIDPLDHRIDEW